MSYFTPPPPTPLWKRTGDAPALAIDLDDAKTHLNRALEDTFWDAETERFVRVATREIERECSLSLTPGVFTVTLPHFADRIRLTKMRPFVAVTQIEYVATDGVITTLPTTIYHVLPVDQSTGMVFLGDGQAWPETAQRHDAVRITVKAGFALDAEDEAEGYPERPDEITHALLMTVASLDVNRGDTGNSGGGSNVTVYAMKNARGGGIIPIEAKTLLAAHTYRWITVG